MNLRALRIQVATARILAKHGALSEVVGSKYLKPWFRDRKKQERA